MDTNKLEVLLKVAKIGSLKKAAEELNYTQSGLIYMMNTLEQEIGVELLSRTPKGVFLSEAGKRLEPFIRDVVWSENALMDEVEEISKDRSHRLRIGVYPIFARYILPEIVMHYMEDYPDDDISIQVGTGDDIERWIQEESIDMAIGEESLVGKGKWIYLMEDMIYAGIPDSFQIQLDNGVFKPENIGACPVLYTKYNEVGKLIDDLMEEEDIKKLEVNSQDGSAVLSMANRQLGIAFTSSLYREDCPKKVKMVPVDPPVKRQLGIILPPDSEHQSQMLKRFITYLQDADYSEFEG